MNSVEFKAQMKRLEDRYGEKAYGTEFARILWKDAQHSPDGALTRTVDAIVTEHFRPIGKNAILELLKQESAKLRPKGTTQSRIIHRDCPSCMGDGLAILFDERGGKSVWSCDRCANGKIQRETSGTCAPNVLDGLRRGYRRSCGASKAAM